MELEEPFAGHPESLERVRQVQAIVAECCGPAQVRVSRSQAAFRRRRGFTYVRRPDRWLRLAYEAAG